MKITKPFWAKKFIVSRPYAKNGKVFVDIDFKINWIGYIYFFVKALWKSENSIKD